jgi:hypothetical protein
MSGQHGGGLGALQGQQGAVFQALDGRLALQGLGDDGVVVVLAGAVDDDEQAVVVGTGGHQVVDHPALVVQQHGVALLAGLEAL